MTGQHTHIRKIIFIVTLFLVGVPTLISMNVTTIWNPFTSNFDYILNSSQTSNCTACDTRFWNENEDIIAGTKYSKFNNSNVSTSLNLDTPGAIINMTGGVHATGGVHPFLVFDNCTVQGFPNGINLNSGNTFFNLAGGSTGASIFSGGVCGDAYRRVRISAAGVLMIGNGSSDVDTQLGRCSANQFCTSSNDDFWVRGDLIVRDTTVLDIVNISSPATSCATVGDNCFTVQVNGSVQACQCVDETAFNETVADKLNVTTNITIGGSACIYHNGTHLILDNSGAC